MKITANLNDYIFVKLTDAGERAWATYWAETHPSGVPEPVRTSATAQDGRLRFHLWEAMNIFGPTCYMGVAVGPFVANEIELQQS